MPTKTLLFVVLVLLGVGLFNQTAYRVLETEKAILLEFGNLVDADVKPGLHFKLPIAQDAKMFDARVLTLDSSPETYYTLAKPAINSLSTVKLRGAETPTKLSISASPLVLNIKRKVSSKALSPKTIT